MTIQEKHRQALFPDYIREQPMVDQDGNLVSSWDIQLGALFQGLQANYTDEGIVIPPLTAAQIAQIQSLYTPYVGGTIEALTKVLPINTKLVDDSTNSVLKVFRVIESGGIVTFAGYKTITET